MDDRVSFSYRNGVYLTLVNGRVEEAHRDFAEFLESLRDFSERWVNRRVS